MATPQNDIYTAAAGARTIRMGHGTAPPPPPPPPPPPAPTYAIVGDSLTFGGAPDLWMVGLLGGQLRRISSCGWDGDSVSSCLARMDNDYKASPPGLAGLPEALGYVFLRIGTNGARWGAVIDDTTKGQYMALFAKILSYCARLIVQSIPPVPTFEATIATWNTWQQAQCAANPSQMTWMDDSAGTYSGGVQNPVYFVSDGVHWSTAARYQLALTGKPVLEALIAPHGYPSPLTASPVDLYPAQPQWFTNPANTGTVAVSGAFAGNVVSGLSIISVPSGFAGTTSIVAADGGDAITAPWQRMTFTGSAAAAGGPLELRSILAGRSVTDVDPGTFHTIVQLRLIAIDPAAIQGVEVFFRGATTSQRLQSLGLNFGVHPGGAITKTVVISAKEYRKFSAAEAGLHLLIDITGQSASSGTLGSIDFRCINIRG